MPYGLFSIKLPLRHFNIELEHAISAVEDANVLSNVEDFQGICFDDEIPSTLSYSL